MSTLFISDLHLSPHRPKLTAIFLRFLQVQAQQADALYILGDFFEVWLGDDVATPFTHTIGQALHALVANGVPVYFMHGNRDFLLGEHFLRSVGGQLLDDPTLINLYGIPTLLLHGDTLCWQDTAYQRLRRIVRKPRYQALFLKLPLRLRSWIAQRLRRSGKVMLDTESDSRFDATPAAIVHTLRAYAASHMIHGHTHHPAIELNFSNPPYQRFVLSDWETTGNALIYHADHTYALTYFN